MQIQITTPFTHAGQRYAVGETHTVDAPLGRYFCAASWARDLAGDVPTGSAHHGDTLLQADTMQVDTRQSWSANP